MTVDLFFYGLFMDRTLLANKGLAPTVLGPARLDDHVLRIGTRAALVPEAGGVCFGIVMQLESDEVDELYSEPSVKDYRPHRLSVTLLARGGEREVIEATCYNLPPESIGTTVNRTYVASLAELATNLDLPAGYIHEIRSLGDPHGG